MKILILASYFPNPKQPTAGIWALEQAKALKKLGNEIIVVSPTPWIPKILALTQKFKKYSQIPNFAKIEGIPIYYPKCFYYPTYFNKRFIYSKFPHFEFLSMWLGTKEIVQKLIQKNNFDLVHCHHPYREGKIALKIKKIYNLPYTVTEHTLDVLKLIKKNKASKNYYKKVIKNAEATITVSKKVTEEMKPLVEKREIIIIRNGVNINKVKNIKAERKNKKKILLSVGSLIERKGHKYLIKAVYKLKNEFPNIKCLIIGEGRKRKSLQKIINKLNLSEYINLLGKKSHKRVLKYMKECDVFVLPSWNEPFATVYPEAMGFGKPIIACQGEGLDDIIIPWKNGILVEKKDTESLIFALRKILKHERKAEEIGKNAKQLVEKKLTWMSNAKKLMKIFKRIA